MATGKRKNRSFNPMSLAFLDVMSCGFGAVVLIFLILDHSSQTSTGSDDAQATAEVNLLQEEIEEGEENRVRVRNTLSEVDNQLVEAQGLASSIQEEIEDYENELAQVEDEESSSEEEVQALRQEIAALETQIQSLREAEVEAAGSSARRYVGDGNRQYLTGLILGGNRILVLVDSSASMLDDTIVNIIRRRNMSTEEQRGAEKWQRVLETVDWLSTQLPIPSQYQLYTFNSEVSPVLPGTLGQWLEVADEPQLDQAISNLRENVVPANGTNLERVFQAVQGLNPLPDNIYLVTDGLPTLAQGRSNSGTVSGSERERIFEQSLQSLPSGIPVNVIMLPLEGDPMAASAYWQLAVATGGSFLNPSEDWP